MKKMDAYFKYWDDPNYIIVDAGHPEQTIDWLSRQTPETWHRVAMTWNYDYEDKVLSWILKQENCDKGTAARVFNVEGFGHWIWDEKLAENGDHVCSFILNNWGKYSSGQFYHHPENKERLLEQIRKQMDKGLYSGTPILEVAKFTGSREAVSEFESEDGKIVVAFDHWLRTNGIEITE